MFHSDESYASIDGDYWFHDYWCFRHTQMWCSLFTEKIFLFPFTHMQHFSGILKLIAKRVNIEIHTISYWINTIRVNQNNECDNMEHILISLETSALKYYHHMLNLSLHEQLCDKECNQYDNYRFSLLKRLTHAFAEKLFHLTLELNQMDSLPMV